MFKWLNRKLENASRREHQYSNEIEGCEVKGSPISQLRIGITSANGGHIVNFETTDRKTHNHTTTNYVIHDGLDFNEELGKMITMETLKLW